MNNLRKKDVRSLLKENFLEEELGNLKLFLKKALFFPRYCFVGPIRQWKKQQLESVNNLESISRFKTVSNTEYKYLNLNSYDTNSKNKNKFSNRVNVSLKRCSKQTIKKTSIMEYQN